MNDKRKHNGIDSQQFCMLPGSQINVIHLNLNSPLHIFVLFAFVDICNDRNNGNDKRA